VGFINELVAWHTLHKDQLDLLKDIVFAVGLVATIYGYFKFLKFLTRRGVLNKRQQMENDANMYSEIHDKLKEYVDSYGATQEKRRDIGIRLLYIKNYPYNLDDDGFRQELYYYFMSDYHKAGGYISGKGLYVMNYFKFMGNSIYYNQKNKKWFIEDKGKSFKHFIELKQEQLVMRIPFENIYGFDFNSDWAEKGEPVFYTKYKYYKWKLFANELRAINIKDKYHLASSLELEKRKRTKRFRTFLRSHKRRIRSYFITRKHSKMLRKKIRKSQ
jgi:hypothetical protein